MKKRLLLFLVAFFLFANTPHVFAATTYGVVKDITQDAGDSLSSGQGTLTTKGDTTTIRYSAATFKMLEADPHAAGGARPGPAAWIGFEVTEPTDQQDSKFKVTTPDGKTTEITTSSFKDFVGITPENLKNVLLKGTVLSYRYSFDWNEDGSNDQYVILEIDPEGITLIPTNGGASVWSPSIARGILNQQVPNTADIPLLFFLGLLLFGGAGLIYYFKKA